MKNLKYALVAALVACTIVCLATSEGIHGTKKIVNITLERAIQIPGMAAAMYQQLNPGFLSVEKPIYYVKVSYKGNIFQIRGTYEQWVKFFKSKCDCPTLTYEPMRAN